MKIQKLIYIHSLLKAARESLESVKEDDGGTAGNLGDAKNKVSYAMTNIEEITTEES